MWAARDRLFFFKIIFDDFFSKGYFKTAYTGKAVNSPMDLNDLPSPTFLVQAIHILGDDRLNMAGSFHFCQGEVCRIRPCRKD